MLKKLHGYLCNKVVFVQAKLERQWIITCTNWNMQWQMLYGDNRGYHQQLNHWRATPNKTLVTYYLVNKNTKKEIKEQKVYIQTIYSDFSVYL